jgi:hypothetical protein
LIAPPSSPQWDSVEGLAWSPSILRTGPDPS